MVQKGYMLFVFICLILKLTTIRWFLLYFTQNDTELKEIFYFISLI